MLLSPEGVFAAAIFLVVTRVCIARSHTRLPKSDIEMYLFVIIVCASRFEAGHPEIRLSFSIRLHASLRRSHLNSYINPYVYNHESTLYHDGE